MDRVCLEQALQTTNAGDMRDRELLLWLRAAEAWLPLYGGQINICLQLVRILCTFPWARFTSAKHSTGSTTTTSKKTISKMVHSFEKLCCALISRGQQFMVPTLEAALKPFSTVGVRNAVPIDSISRIINHCAVTYPTSVHHLIVQALDPLCPPKRWGTSFHHECYFTMLLNLALEAQLPTGCALIGSFKELAVLSNGGDLPVGYSSVGLAATPKFTPMLSAAAGGGGNSSGGGGAGGLPQQHRYSGLVSPNEDNGASDAAGNSGGGVQLSGHNKLMIHQVRLVGLVLTKLMEMEMGIEYEDAAIETIVDERRRRKRSRKEASSRTQSSANSVSSSVGTPLLNGAHGLHHHHTSHGHGHGHGGNYNSIADTSSGGHSTYVSSPNVSSTNGGGAAALYTSLESSSAADLFGYEQQTPHGFESPIHMLQMAVARVYDRLAAEMRHRRAIGSCDRPSWWSEVQAFHVECASKIKSPTALHFLAPSLAALGVAGEATELMHKVVSAVIKGACEKRPSVVQAASAAGMGGMGMGMGGGMGMGMGRMAPPLQQSDKLNPKQRVQAATHVFPLFLALQPYLQPDTCEGLVRRLLKFAAAEGSPSPSSASLSASDAVVDAVLAQGLCMSRALQRDGSADSTSSSSSLLSSMPAEVRARILQQLEEGARADAAAGGGGGGGGGSGTISGASSSRGHHQRRLQHFARKLAAAEGGGGGEEREGADGDTGGGGVSSCGAVGQSATASSLIVVDAAGISSVCDGYIRRHLVKPELYTAGCPWVGEGRYAIHQPPATQLHAI